MVNNYRPIALISNYAKIFETIILIRLQKFLTDNNILNENQFGFTKNKGTDDALTHITNLIYSNIDQDKSVIATFLDLAKAFDTVQHPILLQKLYRHGIRGLSYNLFKTYLSNRKQRVRVNGVYGDFQPSTN